MAEQLGTYREYSRIHFDFLKIFFKPTDIHSRPKTQAQTGIHKMSISNLQIYNAVIAYNRQKKATSSLQRKKSTVSPLGKDEKDTSEEKNNPAIDVEEKDDK